MRQRISPATTIALVALFFSMTGAGMAATGYRITSLWQIAPRVRRELRGRRGPRGRAGAPGAQGPQGAQGPAGLSAADILQHDYVVQQSMTVPASDNAPGSAQQLSAVCQPGDTAVSGGFDTVGTTLTMSGPNTLDTGWVVSAYDDSATTPGTVYALVVCAPTH